MDNWLALYLSIIWYCDITPEQALNHLEGKVRLALPRVGEIDAATTEQIYRTIKRADFQNIDKLEKKYKMHRCDICRSILQRYGGEAMSVCGDSCRGAGRPRTRKYSDVVKEEKQDIRERKAKENTLGAKNIMQSLIAGDRVILTYEKRTATVMIVSKNDRILTVRDEQGRIDTIHIADIVTKEAKIQGMGA